jgi:hypothetical protein
MHDIGVDFCHFLTLHYLRPAPNYCFRPSRPHQLMNVMKAKITGVAIFPACGVSLMLFNLLVAPVFYIHTCSLVWSYLAHGFGYHLYDDNLQISIFQQSAGLKSKALPLCWPGTVRSPEEQAMASRFKPHSFLILPMTQFLLLHVLLSIFFSDSDILFY